MRGAAHQLGRGIHACIDELHVRKAAGGPEAHVSPGRAAGGYVPRGRRSAASGLDGTGLCDVERVPRARSAGRLGFRVASRNAVHARGRRPVPGGRPRARLGPPGSRRDDRRIPPVPGSRAGPRLARHRGAALRQAHEGLPERSRGDARHDDSPGGDRRRSRGGQAPACRAGSRPQARLPRRPQSRGDARAAVSASSTAPWRASCFSRLRHGPCRT